ncbi:MAG: acetylglutamate kinase [Elusimicrobiota bacterium]
MAIKSRIFAAAAFALLGALGALAPNAGAAMVETTGPLKKNDAVALRDSMRNLWAEHVIWTRAYVVAAVAGTPDATAVSIRLLKNQADIGEAFAPYYGKEAAAKIEQLLRQHILIAAEVVDAVKIGDDVKFRDADKRWHDNAAEIAAYLSGINPLLSKRALNDMFNDHLDLTMKEAVSRLNKKWVDDIASFDEILRQMMMMADDLSNAIIKQTPDKF